jgi:hypothetical protein
MPPPTGSAGLRSRGRSACLLAGGAIEGYACSGLAAVQPQLRTLTACSAPKPTVLVAAEEMEVGAAVGEAARLHGPHEQSHIVAAAPRRGGAADRVGARRRGAAVGDDARGKVRAGESVLLEVS